MRSVEQEGAVSLQVRDRVDHGFGGGVAFDHVALQDVLTVARQGDEVEDLNVEQCGQESEVVEICRCLGD